MSYHILEVRKVENGKILSSEFFIVNGEGEIVSVAFGSLGEAIVALKELLGDTPPPSGARAKLKPRG